MMQISGGKHLNIIGPLVWLACYFYRETGGGGERGGWFLKKKLKLTELMKTWLRTLTFSGHLSTTKAAWWLSLYNLKKASVYCINISISSSTIPIMAAEGEVIDRLQKKKSFRTRLLLWLHKVDEMTIVCLYSPEALLFRVKSQCNQRGRNQSVYEEFSFFFFWFCLKILYHQQAKWRY